MLKNYQIHAKMTRVKFYLLAQITDKIIISQDILYLILLKGDNIVIVVLEER